ncbi:unnamed protein product [Meloidogyne enterolobii]|uniref:Uncharacterized protein n=1 Tax=Meloidogyne enterolobii TaxID=390850 RepID=A0ACB0XQ96_MELEN
MACCFNTLIPKTSYKTYSIIYQGLTCWEELQQINGARSRYFTAVEARNNFVNSINNIQSCRVYLGRVRFPYVTEEEIQSMELAIQNAFNDLQSNVALKRARDFFNFQKELFYKAD